MSGWRFYAPDRIFYYENPRKVLMLIQPGHVDIHPTSTFPGDMATGRRGTLRRVHRKPAPPPDTNLQRMAIDNIAGKTAHSGVWGIKATMMFNLRS